MAAPISVVGPQRSGNSNRWRTWRLLIPILILALLMRVGYLSGLGLRSDLELNTSWASSVYQNGLFNLYKQNPPDYPPIYMAMLGVVARLAAPYGALNVDTNAELVRLLKLFPVLADLLMITVVYGWLRRRPNMRWLIPGLLAIYPGVFADSAWWGQTDSLLTLLLILTLIALNRNRPLIAWAFFAVALLTKFQGIVLLPLLFTLTFRRYGVRRGIMSVVLAGTLFIVGLAPFAATSGLGNTLRPYLGSVDIYPYITANAYNVWHLVGQVTQINRYADNLPEIGPLSFKQIGFGLLGLYTLLMCVIAYRQADKPREFVWAAAQYVGFFMLPTEIHERYLYMGAVLCLVAVAQDRRLWWVALGLAYTFSFNLLNVAEPLQWLWLSIWPRTTTWPVAIINVTLLIELTWIAFSSTKPTKSAVFSGIAPSAHHLLKANRIVALVAFLALVFGLEVETASYRQTAAWLVEHVAGAEHLVYDTQAGEVVADTAQWQSAQSWVWHLERFADRKPAGEWLHEGDHYLLLDERGRTDKALPQRLDDFVNQGATIIYQSNNPLGIGARQAVLWTFRPTFPLNLDFDNGLHLIGYQASKRESGTEGILLLWYTRQAPAEPYNIFMHLLDGAARQLVAQADAPLGKGTHPTDTWRPGELGFETMELPAEALQNLTKPYHLRLGLYRLDNGQRAQITTAQGSPVGDSIEITLP